MAIDFLRLTDGLPIRRKPNKESFPTNAKAVRLWADALPLANSGATAKQLYNGLKELNTLEFDAIARLETLEILREKIQFTLSAMDKHIIGQPLPLPQQKRQIGQVMKDFHRELAIGYKLAIVDMCAPRGSVPFLRGKYAVLGVVRCIEHWALLLSKCYTTYSEVPDGCWKELHDMLAYAVSQNLHEKNEKDPQLQGYTMNAMSCYLQAMLMFVANPYRLTQREIVDVEAACRVWASYVLLRMDNTGTGVFLVDASKDAPPGVRVADGAERVWRIDFSGLVQHLRGQIDVADKSLPLIPKSRLGQSVGLSVDLVERLLLAWGFGGERLHQRLPAGHMLEVVIGLQAAHYLVANNADFNAFVTNLSHHGVNLSDRERSAAWAQASSESAKPVLSRVEVQDQSVGGYRIYWPNAANLRAKVGELVAMATQVEEGDDDPRDWMIGVLRWLRGGDNDSLEAGVQLLTRQAEPIAVRATLEGRNKVLHRGLVLTPLNHEGHTEPMLLTNTLMEQSHQAELLRLPDEFGLEPRLLVNPIGSVKQLENSGSYKIFQFAMGSAPLGATEHKMPGAELESIWSSV